LPTIIYGGTDDNDNSGVLKYISIRHGGTDIGAGNEINGLTLGGVGSGTTIEYVEIIANQDDGIEFFGGKPIVKHAVTAFCGDDAFDYDEGFRGYGQYWVAIQEPDNGDRGGEHDGGTTPEDGTPYAHPYIYNATYVGRGAAAGKRAITFRDNAGGEYHNSIFYNWAKGVDIEMLSSGEDSYKRFKAGELKLENNVFYQVADDTPEGIFKVSFGTGASANPDSATAAATFANYFTSAGNTVANPGITYDFSAKNIVLVPTNTSNVTGTVSTPVSGAGLDNVNYKGAFDPNGSNWLKGWTYLDKLGYIQ
jgi:hypothetical protein